MEEFAEFVQRVIRMYAESQRNIGERFVLGLTDIAVRNFVEAGFFASMIPNEGRFPNVCLMCYSENDPREYHFPFLGPAELTPQSIARLAYAVGYRRHLYCLSKKGSLAINGIQISLLNELRQLGYDTIPIANPLKMVIRGPGHIAVSCGSGAVIFRAGTIEEEYRLEHSQLVLRMAQRVEEQLQGQTRGRIETLPAIFNDIAKAIIQLGHGGMVLVSRNFDLSQFSTARRVDSSLLRRLLIQYWNHVADLNAVPGGQRMLMNDETQGVVGHHGLTISSDTSMLENCVSTIGSLAGVDGAIVMDYQWDIVAFNAITSRNQPAPERYVIHDMADRTMTYEQVVGERGSRHQSALSYVIRVPDSFAFVISQDGGLSAFHNTGKDTILYEFGLHVVD